MHDGMYYLVNDELVYVDDADDEQSYAPVPEPEDEQEVPAVPEIEPEPVLAQTNDDGALFSEHPAAKEPQPLRKVQPIKTSTKYAIGILVLALLLISTNLISVYVGAGHATIEPEKSAALSIVNTGTTSSASSSYASPSVTQPSVVPVPVGMSGKWRLAWHDDFAGSSLDTKLWNTCFVNQDWMKDATHCIHDQSELELYGPEGVSVSNGNLVLTATHANGSYPSGMVQTGPSPYTHSGFKQSTFTYGYFEMRAKLPKGKGLWPAFWMIPIDRYPPEIDNFEVLGESPSTIYMTYHPAGGGQRQVQDDSVDTSDGYHVYGLNWQPGFIQYYVDGQTKPDWKMRETDSDGLQMYLIINLAIGGDWPVPPDKTTPFPAQMLVDYVRVYQQ